MWCYREADHVCGFREGSRRGLRYVANLNRKAGGSPVLRQGTRDAWGLFNIIRSFLETMKSHRVMLDPELRSALLQICFHRRAAGHGLFLVRLALGWPGSSSLCRVVPQVSGDQDGPRLGQLQGQNLVAGRVTWSVFDHDRSIAEDIVIRVGGGGSSCCCAAGCNSLCARHRQRTSHPVPLHGPATSSRRRHSHLPCDRNDNAKTQCK